MANLPHTVSEASFKAVIITHDERNGFSACLETVFELPKLEGHYHCLVINPGSKTVLSFLRTDGTVWEYDISPLRSLNMPILRKLDDLMSLARHPPQLPVPCGLPESAASGRQARRSGARRAYL